MDVLIFILVLAVMILLFAGVYGLIKSAADRMLPPAPPPPAGPDFTPAQRKRQLWLEMVRERKRISDLQREKLARILREP
ncbi:hypothetical protein MASR1M8_13460 [Thermomonas brevis]